VALTHLKLGVSPYSTPVGVQWLYDTCPTIYTSVQKTIFVSMHPIYFLDISQAHLQWINMSQSNDDQ